MQTEELLPTGQAARRLGVSPNWVRELVKHGGLEHVDTPLGMLIRPDSLEAYARGRAARQKIET